MTSQAPMLPQGFFGRLFDFSFQSFVTVSIIRLLYAIFLLLAGLAALFFVIAALSANAAFGVIVLIISPLIFLLYAIIARVYLEVVVVLFRIAENTSEMAANSKR